jgi:hypothetical protein
MWKGMLVLNVPVEPSDFDAIFIALQTARVRYRCWFASAPHRRGLTRLPSAPMRDQPTTLRPISPARVLQRAQNG